MKVKKIEQEVKIVDNLLQAEQEGKRLEQEGKELFLQGVLKRGKAYADYIGKGNSQRDAAKFFGVSSPQTINNYLKVSSSVGQPQIAEKIEELEEPSLRKMLDIVKKEKDKEYEDKVKEAADKKIDKIKESISKEIEDITLKEKVKAEKKISEIPPSFMSPEETVSWNEWFESKHGEIAVKMRPDIDLDNEHDKKDKIINEIAGHKELWDLNRKKMLSLSHPDSCGSDNLFLFTKLMDKLFKSLDGLIEYGEYASFIKIEKNKWWREVNNFK